MNCMEYKKLTNVKNLRMKNLVCIFVATVKVGLFFLVIRIADTISNIKQTSYEEH